MSVLPIILFVVSLAAGFLIGYIKGCIDTGKSCIARLIKTFQDIGMQQFQINDFLNKFKDND